MIKKLEKGCWYPCVDDALERSIFYFDGDIFCLIEGDKYGGVRPDLMRWIGESMGSVKFPDVKNS